MKLLTQEEVDAQQTAVMYGGIKGAIFGTCISLGIYAMAPRHYPKLFSLPYSIRTLVAVIPPLITTTIFAETSSNEFDKKMYSSEYEQRRTLEEHLRWKSLSFTDKTIEILSENRYKIITGLWILSLYGSWLYTNRDKMLTQTQKLVIARMYAQFLTVGLLLASVGLSVYEENHQKEAKKQFKVEDSWKEIVDDEEQREKIIKEHPELAEKRQFVKKHFLKKDQDKEVAA